MKSEEYWAKRMEDLNEAELKKGEDYIKVQNAEYDKAMARIKKETEAWYGRLAKNNEISMAEARKLLTANELKEFHWTVDDYIKAGRENAVDQRWMKELENASAKAHISRLEELQTKLRQEVELLTARRVKGTAEVLGDIYKDGYYKGIYEVQRGAGEGIPFAKLDGKQIDKVLAKPWAPDGKNFSARIWADRDKLLAELQTVLTQDLIRGEPSDKVISDFAGRMGVSKSAAERLILTEAAYFSGQSRMDGYKEQGIKSYQFVATLDSKTSKECRHMDGEVIPLSEAKPGVNYPPLHAYCRSTTIPVFEDDVELEPEPGERAARGSDKQTYSVPSNVSYKDWAVKHAPKDAEQPPAVSEPPQVTPPVIKTVGVPGEVEEPRGFNRRYNPKASYHIDLPNVSEEVSEKLSAVNREIARQGSKEGKEILVTLDEKGEEVSRVAGEANKVRFTPELHESLLAAPARSVILTHNHPRGTRINVKDAVNLASYPSLTSVVAVGHDGGVSSVSANTSSGDAVALHSILKKTFDAVYEQLQKDKRYAKMSKTAQEEYFDYLVLMKLVQEMGWEYGEDFSAAKEDPRI